MSMVIANMNIQYQVEIYFKVYARNLHYVEMYIETIKYNLFAHLLIDFIVDKRYPNYIATFGFLFIQFATMLNVLLRTTYVYFKQLYYAPIEYSKHFKL